MWFTDSNVLESKCQKQPLIPPATRAICLGREQSKPRGREKVLKNPSGCHTGQAGSSYQLSSKVKSQDPSFCYLMFMEPRHLHKGQEPRGSSRLLSSHGQTARKRREQKMLCLIWSELQPNRARLPLTGTKHAATRAQVARVQDTMKMINSINPWSWARQNPSCLSWDTLLREFYRLVFSIFCIWT